MYPIIPDKIEPKNIPDLEYSCPKLATAALSGKANALINRLIVNPIPQRNDTPKMSYIVILLGKLHNLNLIEIYVSSVIPIGLPSSNPSIIPIGTVFERDAKLIEFKSISALKNAKSGSIINPEKVWSFSSKYLRGEWLVFLTEKGIVAAKITPAIVVWTPECKIKYQRNNPNKIYILIIHTLHKLITISIKNVTKA